jgi:glycosyltransferase involved in cell wall biosynthesis
MKKVLFVAANPWAAWGGSEKLWVYTAKYLQRHHLAKTGVLIRKWDSIEPVLGELLQASTVFLYQSQNSIICRCLGKLFSRFRSDARKEQLFRNAIKRLVPDLVIVSQGANYDGLKWMELCNRYEVPFVTISHAANEAFWLDSQSANSLAFALSQARHNFFVSQGNLRLTELMVGKRLPNSSVLANPFDVPYDSHLEFPSVAPEFKLACVARFELHAKGQDVLLEALSDPKWKGRNLSVELYGSGRDQCHVEKLIKYFELEKSVRIVGFTRPVEIWKTNHALVLPSRYEGLPIALVEAMMCGRFGIVTNVSGNAEVVEDSLNGFIAEAPKALYLDHALERAWARRSEWEAIGQKARNVIKEKVPPDPVAEFARVLTRLC